MNLHDILQTIQNAFGVPTIKPELVTTPDGTARATLVRDGYRLEKLDAGQRIKRIHAFDDLESFATWLRHQVDVLGYDSDVVEVLVGQVSVTALLEPGERHGDQVTCQLVPHPMFAAWRRTVDHACGGPMTFNQEGLFSFVRGVEKSIVGPGDFTGKILAGEIAKIKVTKGAEINSELDTRGIHTVRATGENTAVASRIPAEILVRTPIFSGVFVADPDDPAGQTTKEAIYDLEVMVSMSVDTGILFRLECPQLPIVMHQARRDAVAYLKGLLGEKFRVCLGVARGEAVPAQVEE